MALAPTPITEINPEAAKTPAADPASAPAADPAAGAPPAKLTPPEGFGLTDYFSEDKGVDYARLTDDVKALTAFKAERDALAAQVPDAEHLDEYEVALPEGFEVPEGMTVEAIKDHPILADARAFAKEAGLTKDQFKGLVALQAKAQLAEFNQLKEAAKAELAKLGSKGSQRVQSVNTELTAAIGTEKANALLPMMFNAAQIEAFEALLARVKGGGVKLNGAGREPTNQPPELTEEQWNAMSATARIEYGRSHPVQRKTG